MPTLTRWFIRTSLIYFVAALVVGIALMLQAGLGLSIPIAALGPVYFHLFMVGWVAQLIFGVIFWMFPKFSREKPRGSERLGWATYVLLNAGLLLRVVGEPLHSARPELGWGWLLAVSAVAQWLAGMAFVANTWGRVKEK
jgi:hypothetical protein